MKPPTSPGSLLRGLITGACLAVSTVVAHAQSDGPPPAAGPRSPPVQMFTLPQGPAAVVPNFWNVERRLERPDAAQLPTTIRFLTTSDFPPFNYLASDGALLGFNVDLARAICAELAVTCTLQPVAFENLLDQLDQGEGDAILAGLASSPAMRQRVDFTERYLGTPARFAARKGLPPTAPTPESVADKKVAVVSGTAHEAYLRAFFNEAAIRTFPNAAAARDALRIGEVDLLFGDGIGLALWLNGTSSESCCGFVGGPFTENRYFGDGLAVAVKPGGDLLRQAIDYALQRIWEKGVFADLYLRWFPVGFY